MRRAEERRDDVRTARMKWNEGDQQGAFDIVCRLLEEDPYEFVDHSLRAGRQDQGTNDIQDFRISSDGWLHARQLKVASIGNPSQIFMRRAGPDGAEYNAEPERCDPGQNIGHIAWQANEGPGNGWSHRNAQIYARRGVDAGEGSLHFQTSGKERMVIGAEGSVTLYGPDGREVRLV